MLQSCTGEVRSALTQFVMVRATRHNPSNQPPMPDTPPGSCCCTTHQPMPELSMRNSQADRMATCGLDQQEQWLHIGVGPGHVQAALHRAGQGRDSPHLAVIKVVVKVHVPIQWVIGVAPALHVLTASWAVGRCWVKLWRS